MVFVALFSMFALGQETTGNIDITVKDKAGAVVPNVSITVASTGESVGFKRTVTTDGSGFARVIQIPPGVYSVTAGAAAGFVEQKVDQVDVSLGKTTPVNIEMTTSVGATVDVNASDVATIDVTSTKIETTISSKTAELLPKGVNFSTILKLDPATRPEPRSGQFQIDGASGSENSFIVDGQEVTNVLNGVLNGNSNIPFSQIQEVQVKSSGFGAEYGGATGGVVNVVTKGGSDTWNGEFGLLLRSSRAEPIAEGTVSRSLLNAEGLPFVYPSRRDQYNERNFTAHLTGPILKRHLWFAADYSPQIFTQDRILHCGSTMDPNCTPGRSDHYFFKQRAEKTHGRLDAQLFTKLHLTANYYWQPIIQRGPNPFPSFASEQTALAKQPVAVNPLIGAAFLNTTGGRQNSQSFSSGGSYV
jgi:outer membrane receptor protein involved in Fe transport